MIVMTVDQITDRMTNKPSRFSVKGLREWLPSTFKYTLTLDATDFGHKPETDFFVFNQVFFDYLQSLEDDPAHQYEVCSLLQKFIERLMYGKRESYQYGGSSSMPWPNNDFERFHFSEAMEVPLLIEVENDEETRSFIFPLYKLEKSEVRKFCKKNFTKYRIEHHGEILLNNDPYSIKMTKDVLSFMSLTGKYKQEVLPWEML